MTDNIKEVKSKLRNEIIAIRGKLTADEVQSKSEAIFTKLMKLDKFSDSRWIMTYIDFRNEVSTRNFINSCLSLGKRIAVPKVVKDDYGKRSLWACEITDLENDLEVSNYGILEPKNEQDRRIDPKRLDLIVVPGLAFDSARYRLGYGAGYYDRFLTAVSEDCLNIGVAFNIQIVDKVPIEAHDVPLNMVITENRIL